MAKKKRKNKYTADGFVNIQKGLATAKDHQGKTHYRRSKYFNYNELSTLYSTNWLAANVVDVPVEDSLRNWREITSNNSEKIMQEEKRLGLQKAIEKAEKWALVFGGAAIVIISDDGELHEPFNINAMSRNGLKRLVVLDRYNLIAQQPNMDILAENYGEPEFYQVAIGGQTVHHSRVIRFDGIEPTIEEKKRNNYWGNSIYEKLYDAISNSQTSTQLINGLLYESNIDVYKIKGLNSLVAQGQDELVVKRIQMAHELKSTVNGIVLDSEDDFVKKGNTFAGLAEIDDKFLQKVAGARGVPVTKLLGISPGGLNATGESDIRNYYDKLSSIQESKYTPKLKKLDEIITASLFGSTQEVEFEWNTLWQMNDKDKAAVELSNAQRDVAYVNAGILTDDEIRPGLRELYTLEDDEEEI